MKKVYSIVTYFILLVMTFALFNFFEHNSSNIYADLLYDDFVVWSLPSTVKVKRNEINYPNKGPAEINIDAVKNEYESYQLFITAYKNINSYNLTIADLTDGKGNSILSENISVYNQRYINCNYESFYAKGYYPDALIPLNHASEAGELTVSANNNAALWITFYIPPQTVAGIYTATFNITLDNLNYSIPVTVNVYDYTLTENLNFKTNFANRVLSIAAGELDTSYEMMKEYYDFCLDYRISLKYLPVHADTAEELAAAALEYYDKTACYDIIISDIKKLAEASTPQKNLLAKAYMNMFDEPYMYYRDNPENPLLQNVVNAIKNINVQLNNIANDINNDNSGKYSSFKQIENWRSYITDITMLIPDHFKYAYDEIDDPLVYEYLELLNTYCPIWDTYDDEYRDNYESLLETFNPQRWWYGCLAPQNPYGTYHIADTSLLSARTISWMQKKYNIEGNIYWDAVGYNQEGNFDNFGEMKLTPIDVYEYQYRFANESSIPAGDGNLLYPGAAYGHFGPLPSMRIMSIRDGLEEYEMLHDLEGKLEYLVQNGKYDANSAQELMESLYSPIYYYGNKLNADICANISEQNKFDFKALRAKLLQILSNINTDISSVARTFSPLMNLKLSVNYQNGNIIADTAGGLDNYQYQYWIKTKTLTDNNSTNGLTEQYIWQLFRNYNIATQASISAQDIYCDEYGNYNILVRIKDNNKVIEELYGIYTAADIGQPLISQIDFDGKAAGDDLIIINKGSNVNIKTFANIESYSCKLYAGDMLNPLYSGNNISVSFDEFSQGLHNIKIEISDGENYDYKILKIYVVDEFNSAEMPVITSLQGVSDSGDTTFTMKVRYADGSSISVDDKDKFNYKLISGSYNADLISTQVADGYIEAVFNVDYGVNCYGIYHTVGTVSRKNINGYDDKIIQYYNGYVRTAHLQLSGETEIVAGNSTEITASGTIDGYTGNIEYAFYREDASGWVLIKDYSADGTFNWSPVRAGQYVIQARIKDSNASSYEAVATKIFNVTGATLQGDLNIKIYDYGSGETASIIYAGKPYKLFAEYTGSEDVLYMFTLTSANLGTVYLNNYNPSPYYMFIPHTTGTFTITVRALNCSNFGYMDKSVSLSIEATIPVEYYPEVIDFEDALHKNFINTTNDNNKVNIQLVNYDDESLPYLYGIGGNAVKLTPTVNPWPEFHIVMGDRFTAMVSFDYYIQSQQSGSYAWNYKNADTQEDKGEIDGFSGTNHNTWYHAYHTLDFNSREIWLWLFMDGYSDITQINIYIDNISIVNLDYLDYPEVLDMEKDYHLHFIDTPADNNAVTIGQYSYANNTISSLTDGGKYAVKFTPTVNPYPEMHFILNDTYPSYSVLEFDYYIQSNVSGVYAWNYKNPANGAGMGEIDEFDNALNNTWYHASHTMEFEFNEIWLWLYMDGYSDVTQVNIYIDNFKVTESAFPNPLDFENINNMYYVGTPNSDNAVIIDRVTYSQAGITDLEDGGVYLAKFTPTVNPYPEMHFLLNDTYQANFYIEFDYYIQSSIGGAYSWNYKDPATNNDKGEIDVFDNALSNTWYHAQHFIDFDCDEIWLWLYMEGYSDITQVNIYIDNFKIIRNDYTVPIDFEEDKNMNNIDTTEDGNAVTIERVTYSQAGIPILGEGGNYLLKLSNTNGSEYPEVHIKFFDTYPAGSQLQFFYYIQGANDFEWNYKNPNTGVSLGAIFGNSTGSVGQWVIGYHNLDFESDEVWLWLFSVAGNQSAVKIYIDNIVIVTASSKIDFEEQGQLACVDTPAGGNAVSFELISYAQAGITPLEGGGDNLLKIVNVNGSEWPEIHFKFSKIYSEGATLHFDYYIININNPYDFQWNYKVPGGSGGTPISGNSNGAVNSWVHGSQSFNFDFNEVWLWLAHYAPDRTKVTMYIDNIEIIENN